MAATMAATATMVICPTKSTILNKPLLPKPTSLLSHQNLPKGLTISKPTEFSSSSSLAIAGAIFSSLSSCDSAFAAQQLADIAEGDSRGLALLLPIIPAIAWVLYNILQPALNQINKMRSGKAIIVGLGLGGLASTGFMETPHASAAATEISMLADAAATTDNRGQLLLIVVAPAILWVLYNILQPALNQINKMRSSD